MECIPKQNKSILREATFEKEKTDLMKREENRCFTFTSFSMLCTLTVQKAQVKESPCLFSICISQWSNKIGDYSLKDMCHWCGVCWQSQKYGEAYYVGFCVKRLLLHPDSTLSNDKHKFTFSLVTCLHMCITQ